MTRGFVDTGRFEPDLRRRVRPRRRGDLRGELRRPRRIAGGPIEDVEDFPQRRRRHRRAAVPGVLAAQPRRRRPRAARRSGASTCARSNRAAPSAFVMENVPELLRSDGVRRRSRRGRASSASRRRGDDPQRRRLRRAAAPPARDRRSASRRRRFAWPDADALRPGRAAARAAGRGGRSATPSRACRCKPDGEDWHSRRNPRPTSVRRYKAVPRDGGDRFADAAQPRPRGPRRPRPACWRNKPTGTTDVFGRLWWDRPAFTIRTEFYKPEKGRYLHPSAHRPITVREAARCMSFPDDFVLPDAISR